MQSRIDWKKFYKDFSAEESKVKIKIKRSRSIDDVKELNKFLNKLGRQKRHTGYDNFFKPETSASKLFSGQSKNQRCSTKFRYSQNKQSHLKYLNAYMAQKNKDDVERKPELFGNCSLEEYKKKMTGKHFKFILSPEKNLPEDVLKDFAKCFVTQAEQQLGRKIDWQAAVHQNTAHNHIHLLINGIDQKGNDFNIPKNFVKVICHKMTSNILTDICGKRTQEEIQLANDRKLVSERWTEYDEKILSLSESDSFELEKDDKKEIFDSSVYVINPELKKRLYFLENFGLAKYHKNKYYLQRNWEKSLQAVSKYNTFMQAKKTLRNVMPSSLELYTSETGRVDGQIRKVYSMNDEDIWNNAVVVENPATKKAYYVPVFKPVKKILEGKNVSIHAKNGKGILEPVITVNDNDFKDIKGVREYGKKKSSVYGNNHKNDYDGIEI